MKQKSEQTDGPNSRPLGTSGMASADPLRGQEPCQKQAAVGHRGRQGNMISRVVLTLFLSVTFAISAGPTSLALPDSDIILLAPDGWTINERNGEIGVYSPDQPPKGIPSRIHLTRIKNDSKSLEAAIQTEIDGITSRAPAWGSSNDQRSYKGSVPITTDSGISGLRADFYYDEPNGRRYTIVKYYFFDEHGGIFRVCAHVGGDEKRFKAYEEAILNGLTFRKDKNG